MVVGCLRQPVPREAGLLAPRSGDCGLSSGAPGSTDFWQHQLSDEDERQQHRRASCVSLSHAVHSPFAISRQPIALPSRKTSSEPERVRAMLPGSRTTGTAGIAEFDRRMTWYVGVHWNRENRSAVPE